MFLIAIAILGVSAFMLFWAILIGKFPLNGYPVCMLVLVFLVFFVNASQLYIKGEVQNYLDEWMSALGVLVATLSFLSVLFGWLYPDIKPKKKSSEASNTRSIYAFDRVFIAGSVCHILSLFAELVIASQVGGLLNLYSTPHNFYGAGSSVGNDYIFLLFSLTFIGLVPYLQCLICNKEMPKWQRYIVISVCIIQILRTLIVGQRGWVLNLVFIYLTVPFFCLGKLPKIRTVSLFVVPALLLVILLPAIRPFLYIGGDISRLPEQVSQGLAAALEGDAGSGVVDADDPSRVISEFILGSGIVAKAYEKNEYTWGLSFYEVLINPIPRAIWPEKPRVLGLQSWVNEINDNFNWKFNTGSAPTGIADVFLNFGFWSLPYWFVFGRIHRWAYDQAATPGNFYGQGLYASMLLASVLLLTQGVFLWGTNLIAATIFTTVIYTYAKVNYKSSPNSNASVLPPQQATPLS
jgi:hypothetical protein